ncbi:hypothetical protein OG394_36870 [Kribbella sp. NBC_01245]|uniref:hypothetical protein n=1 Tax=Kribbella sp. NBC_01245 TaxID=2903578 RepID=UPI002E2E7B51|nr:hypothetical protein [Kribbella sp. NBC_01245]
MGHSSTLGARIGGWRAGGPATAAIAAVAACVLGTAIVASRPELVVGSRSPAVHLMLETVDSGIALLLAYLVLGRFQRSARWQDTRATVVATAIAPAAAAPRRTR